MDRATRIMDAAERRIREAGYGGFSFRDLAAEVGVKSASVHHHFPTKAALGAAVARRYADRFLDAVGEGRRGPARLADYRAAFADALREDGRMCLCGVLAAEQGALPPEVAAEARRFFERCLSHLGRAEGVGEDGALRAMAALEGGMLLARALGDATAFERATAALV